MTSRRVRPATGVAKTGVTGGDRRSTENPATRGVASQPRGTEPPVGLDIRHRLWDGTVVVEVAGEVDLDTTPQLQAAIVTCVDQAGDKPSVLNLTAVTFLDSSGLTALLSGTLRAQERQGFLRIVVDSNRPVIRPIAVTGLDEELALYHTVEEAMHAETA
jgi:anti-sigma B factor antagonist